MCYHWLKLIHTKKEREVLRQIEIQGTSRGVNKSPQEEISVV